MVRSLFSNFQPMVNWLCSSLPAFPVKADQVCVLYKPDEFYETLISSCGRATKRILLASLYLGTGEKEKRLVDVITTRVGEKGSLVKVKILLDSMRGSRGEANNSRKMLLPLLNQNANCQVTLFHSPKLKGIVRHLLPTRYNELIGLQHMKIYVVDDDVLVSGANLSHDYFTNRQDRYILVKDCKQLADFFDGLVNIICDMSFQLNCSNETSSPAKYHPYDSPKMYIEELRDRVLKYYSSFIANNRKIEESDTWIFPTIEIPPCDIHVDSNTAQEILKLVPKGSLIHLASGYFNLTDSFVKAILSSKAEFNLLMAHPKANGFHESEGFSKYIPIMYTAIAKNFYELLEKHDENDRISMFEYQKRNWTFHGKGIWVTYPNEFLPAMTVVGSSNYGSRSVHRDLETQLIIVTEDFELKKSLYREQRQLFDYGSIFNRVIFSEPERKVPLWINVCSWLLKSFF